jgi:hypothetical protein
MATRGVFRANSSISLYLQSPRSRSSKHRSDDNAIVIPRLCSVPPTNKESHSWKVKEVKTLSFLESRHNECRQQQSNIPFLFHILQRITDVFREVALLGCGNSFLFSFLILLSFSSLLCCGRINGDRRDHEYLPNARGFQLGFHIFPQNYSRGDNIVSKKNNIIR